MDHILKRTEQGAGQSGVAGTAENWRGLDFSKAFQF